MRQFTNYSDFVRPDGVHGSVYTDPDIFQDELQRIYAREWVYVGHVTEVPNPGDFKRSTIGTAPIILCRDTNGSVQVLFNRCRHRAATVCQEPCGNTKKFRCEYHGWTYDLDGKLTGIPFEEAYDNLDKTEFSLTKPTAIDTYRGFVFACMGKPKISLLENLGGPTMEQIDYFCDLSPEGEILVQAGTVKLVYQGSWKLQMENSIDGYHPNFTHQSYFKTISRMTGVKLDIFNGSSIASVRALGNGNAHIDTAAYNLVPQRKEGRLKALKKTPWGKKYYDDMVEAYGKERAEKVLVVGGTHMNVFPNLVVLGQQVRTIRPIAFNRTEVELAPTLLKGVPDEINTMRIRQFEQFYSPQGGGIHDDVEMFNRVQEGLACTMEPWLLFRRGLHREEKLSDGTLRGQVTDETPQRAMWRHWLEVMEQNVD
ncbi:MAG: aromatic ring-hydroxylating dioxygenase subunit alpha [Pseudomonadales bacterium]|nr:aromatic ring-hydroxylating dioxygenase subunit alpha [Pseudomonadales bacterium]